MDLHSFAVREYSFSQIFNFTECHFDRKIVLNEKKKPQDALLNYINEL